MEFTHLVSFVKISEYNSFSKAAEVLGYSQSALSIQMAKLEKELGVSLFEKYGKRIYLTEYGKTFLEYASQTLRNEQVLKQLLSKQTTEVSGTITIAVPHSLCNSVFSAILISFHRKYPDVKLIVKSGLTDDFLNWLSRNEVDLVYTLDQKIYRPDFETIIESEVNINFFVNALHPLAKKNKITISDIKKYPLYLTEKELSYRKMLEDELSKNNVFISEAIEIGDTDVIKNLLKTNPDGIGFIPEFVVQNEVTNGKIVPLKLNKPVIKMYKQILYHNKKTLTPAINELINEII